MRSNIVLSKTPVKPFNKKLIADIWKHKVLYLFLLPAFILLFLFSYRPMYGIIMAFKEYEMFVGLKGTPWVGFKYFEEFFTHREFLKVVRNTLGVSITNLIIGFPAPIILALMLNEVKSMIFKRTIQTVTYLPHFMSFIVIVGLVHQMLSINPGEGSINDFIRFFGGEPIYFLSIGYLFWPLLALINVFKECGWGAIIYLAALSSINPEYYEAATVDGARKWKQLIHVTIPGIMPTIVVMFILRMGHVMTASFEQVLALQNGFNLNYSDTIEMFVYREGFVNSNFSYATAVGLWQNVINFILVMLTNYFSRKLSDNEQGLF